MSEAKTEFSEEQKQCIYSHDGTLLVSAAAGSGKTLVLIHRILDRITDPAHPTDIDRLLVVTFTRAAASEMKQRLANELAKRIAEDPDNIHLQRQQLLLPRAAIETVDSFCNRLVRQSFHLLDIPPQFRVGDEQQLSLLRNEALFEVLGEFYAADDPDFADLAAMLSSGRSDEALTKAVDRLYDFLQPHPDPNQWLEERSSAYEEPDELANSPWGQIVLEHVSVNLNKAKQLFRHALELVMSGEENLQDNYGPVLKSALEQIEAVLGLCHDGKWDALLAALCTFSGGTPGRKKLIDTDLCDRAKALRSDALKIIKKQASYLCGTEEQCRRDLRDTRRLILMLYRVTRQFSDRFAEKKKAARLFEFSDIEHYALRLLTDTDENGNTSPSALAQELSSQFDEILVDEYQDTNALQDALYVALSRRETNLFLVGDVKQSIYGFRQAMPDLFLRRRHQYPLFDGTNYPGTVMLGNNYRSRFEVTEAVNYVFRQLMSKETGNMAYDDSEALVCKADYPPSDGHEPEILLVDIDSHDGDNKPDSNTAEAIVLAKRIRELVGALPVKGKDGTRPLQYGDCCILLRARRPELIQALKKQGIPVAADDAGSFFNTTEIRLALSLLRCIDNPLQDVPLTAWLMSSLCGFSPDDLAAIRLCRPKTALYNALTAARTKVTDPLLAERCRDAVAFLDRYRTLAGQMTVDRLLLRLYEETALQELMSAQTDGERRRHNLQLLQEHCRQFDQNGFRGLSSFIRYMDRLQAQGIEPDGAAPSPNENAVHVMTIHHSKGLEFPVVFLAGLGHSFNRNDQTDTLLLHAELGAGIKQRDLRTGNRYDTLPRRALTAKLHDDDCAEELRVLYVAMTRAREKLCVSMAIKDPSKTLSALAATLTDNEALPAFMVRDADCIGKWLLAALLRHPDASEWRQRIQRTDLPILPSAVHWVFRWETARFSAETAEAEAPSIAEADPATVEEIRRNMAYEYPHAALARIPAKLAASQAAGHTVQRRFVAQARPAFLANDKLTPAERGTAVHSFMLLADYAAAAVDLETEITRLVRNGLLTAAQAAAIDRGHLSAFFRSPLYRRMCVSSRCLREFPFTAQCPASLLDQTLTDTDEAVVVQGIADCLFIEENELVIVDYKTDRVKTDCELLERYTAQLNTYRASLSKALNMPVRECLLYSFVLDRTIRVEDTL